MVEAGTLELLLKWVEVLLVEGNTVEIPWLILAVAEDSRSLEIDLDAEGAYYPHIGFAVQPIHHGRTAQSSREGDHMPLVVVPSAHLTSQPPDRRVQDARVLPAAHSDPHLFGPQPL